MNSLFNLARVTTATTGTGTITLGAAIAGWLTFAQAGVPDGAIVTYALHDANGGKEIGQGTYTLAGLTLTRTTVYRSTGAGNTAKISLSGSTQVFISAAAEDFGSIAGGVFFGNASGKLSQNNNITFNSVDNSLTVGGYIKSIAANLALFQSYNTAGGTDQKFAELGQISADGNFYCRFVSDNYAAESQWLAVARNTGTYTVKSVTFPTGSVVVGGSVSANRTATFDASGRLTILYGDNANPNVLTFNNNGITSFGQGLTIQFGLAPSGTPTAGNAGRIRVISEGNYATVGASDSSLIFDVGVDNAPVERLRISSPGLISLDGATASFPALKRGLWLGVPSIDVRLADDSGRGVITAKAAVVLNTTPIITLWDESRATDEKIWEFLAFNDDLYLRTVNDAYSLAANAFVVHRGAGYAIADVNFIVPVIQALSASINPINNGELVIQANSNTSLVMKYKGTDGVIRTSAAITLS